MNLILGLMADANPSFLLNIGSALTSPQKFSVIANILCNPLQSKPQNCDAYSSAHLFGRVSGLRHPVDVRSESTLVKFRTNIEKFQISTNIIREYRAKQGNSLPKRYCFELNVMLVKMPCQQ